MLMPAKDLKPRIIAKLFTLYYETTNQHRSGFRSLLIASRQQVTTLGWHKLGRFRDFSGIINQALVPLMVDS